MSPIKRWPGRIWEIPLSMSKSPTKIKKGRVLPNHKILFGRTSGLCAEARNHLRTFFDLLSQPVPVEGIGDQSFQKQTQFLRLDPLHA